MRTVKEAVEHIASVPFSDALSLAGQWPPDLFAITSWLLMRSSAYRCVRPKETSAPTFESWARGVYETAERWRSAINQARGRPASPDGSHLAALVDRLRALGDAELAQLPEMPDACFCLLSLHAVADEACAGLGTAEPSGGSKDSFLYLNAALRLTRDGTLSTFDPSLVRVLPKVRTAQCGLTLRSLSHHVAIETGEVKTVWRSLRGSKPERKLQILLLPWPFEVRARDFVPNPHPEMEVDQGKFGFFDFLPSYRSADLYDCFERTLDAAAEERAAVDMVVLPECAVVEAEFEELWTRASARGVSMLLAGVRGPLSNMAWLRVRNDDRAAPSSGDAAAPLPYIATFKQGKHHRWFLDEGQIQTYGVGHGLHPKRRWWERIDIQQRQLNIVTYSNWLTICHLVCEDLARVDPVAQCLRAIGPNLVIALLLDGPQLGRRWPGRYATVLADDPGSSVLTLTCLGMALRSRPPNTPPSRVVALWKDSAFGDRELTLEDKATGLVLTVWAESVVEYTADGRADQGSRGNALVLGGILQVVPQLASGASAR